MTAHAAIPTHVRRIGAFRPSGRALAALLLCAAGLAMLVQQGAIRVFEAHLAASWFGVGLAGRVAASHDLVIFAWTGGPGISMQVTAECTAALIAGPLCIVAAAMLALPRTSPRRLAVALLASVVTVCVANQIRLLCIAVAVQRWGLSGYELSHRFIGSLISIAGFVAGALLLVRLAVVRPTASPAPAENSAG